MNEASNESLRQAVEGLHGCKAAFKEVVHVTEEFEGETIWDGEIYLFNLKDHPSAKICYTWSSPIPNSDKRRYFAILHAGAVKSASDAVKASIVEDYKRD